MLGKNPLISVITTVYNVEQYIERCLKSILSQSFTDFELIIVDDKTPDNSMSIAEKYKLIDDRIKLIYNEKNLGLMMARKTGVDNAIGEYIVFVDSDDTLAEDALLHFSGIVDSEDYDIFSGNIVYKKLDGSMVIWKSNLQYGNDKISVYKSLLQNEYKHNLCGHIFKRRLLTEYNYIFFENFTMSEDYCLFYQLVNNSNNTGHVDFTVYEYYQTAGSSMQEDLSEKSVISLMKSRNISYHILINYQELFPLLARNFQYFVYYLCVTYPLRRSLIIKTLKESDFKVLFNLWIILKYNRLLTALKLLFGMTSLGAYCMNKMIALSKTRSII